MSGTSKKLLIILIPIVVLLIGLICLLLFLPGNQDNAQNLFVAQISSARKYMDSGDFENAILCYKSAIEEDEKNEDAYLELSRLYFKLNRTAEGIEVLKLGVQNTNSAAIMAMLAEYNGENVLDAAAGKKGNAAVESGINTMNAKVFSTYSYSRYGSEYTVKSDSKAAGKYTVSYLQFDAEFEYADSNDNKVLDPATGYPFPEARPTKIKLNSLNQLLTGADSGISKSTLEKLGGISSVSLGNYDNNLKTYLLSFEYNGMKIKVGCNQNGIITGTNTYSEIVPAQVKTDVATVMVSGDIIDVTTGSKVSSANVQFREGKNSQSGTVAASNSAASGSYFVELAPGDYTAEVSADGYNTEYFDLYVADMDIQENFSISPQLSNNEIRFVLEWGATPIDLDSHLDGTCTDKGDARVSVSFIDRISSVGTDVLAELDIDDRDGYGPETITLHYTGGTYEYRVNKYSYDGSLATSGATVKIYTLDSSAPITVSVPDDVSGDWWTVCKVENGQVKDINGKQS